MKRRIILCIVCAIAFCVLVSGCGKDGGAQTGNVEKEGSAVKDYIVIETEYGNLYYPDQGTECVQIDQSTAGNALVVSFAAQINDVQYPLFKVTIGEGDGSKIGELTDSAGTKRDVYLQLEEIQEDPNLNDGEQNRLYAMQEDLNYLIDNLK